VAATSDVVIDVSSLYGGVSSTTVVDRRQVDETLLSRVRVGSSTLSILGEDAGVEAWTRKLLLTALGDLGAIVLGPTWSAVPEGPLQPEQADTAWLRDVHFASGVDTVAGVVHRDGDGTYQVSIRAHPEEVSLCGDLPLKLDYVELHGTVQRSTNHAVVAVWHEVGVVEIRGLEPLTRTLPDPDLDLGGFCEAIGDLVAHDPDLRPSGRDFETAGRRVLERGLQLVRPIPPQ